PTWPLARDSPRVVGDQSENSGKEMVGRLGYMWGGPSPTARPSSREDCMPRAEGAGDLSLGEVLELARLFEEHRPRLLAMLRARIDPALEGRLGAEAILQETFLAARRRWAGRPAPEQMSPYAWLLWLARQCLVDAWRREHPGREMPWPERSAAEVGLNLVA